MVLNLIYYFSKVVNNKTRRRHNIFYDFEPKGAVVVVGLGHQPRAGETASASVSDYEVHVSVKLLR